MHKHSINTLEQAELYLNVFANNLDKRHKGMCDVVLDNPKFWDWPAAIRHHHNFKGGLAVHTAQVIYTANSMLLTVPEARTDLMFVAGLYHDFGKIFDYGKKEIQVSQNESVISDKWDYTSHTKLIGHLPRSYGEFMIANFKRKVYDEMESEFIGHIILSHHGRTEFGSPVIPESAEAWAFHCADMMSSHYIKNDKLG